MQVRQQRPPPLPNRVPKRSVCLLLVQPVFSLSANVATNYAMHRNSAERQRSEYLPRGDFAMVLIGSTCERWVMGLLMLVETALSNDSASGRLAAPARVGSDRRQRFFVGHHWRAFADAIPNKLLAMANSWAILF